MRSSEEGFSSPAHRFLEGSSGGCTRGRKSLSPHTLSCLHDIRNLLVQKFPRKIEASQAEVVLFLRKLITPYFGNPLGFL